MKIKYTVEYSKHSKKWNVFKNIEYERGTNFYSVFSGTKEECEEWIKKSSKKD